MVHIVQRLLYYTQAGPNIRKKEAQNDSIGACALLSKAAASFCLIVGLACLEDH